MVTPKWTNEEISVLRRYYPSLGGDVVKHLPRRKRRACYTRAQMLGLRHEKFILKPCKLSEFDKGFIIGFIEGEGTISIYYQKRYETETFSLIPSIVVVNTDIELLKYLQERLGGKIYKKSFDERARKTRYKLEIHGSYKVLSILKELQFVSKRKGELANLVIEFSNSRINRNKYHGPFARREIEIYNRIREINPCRCKPKHTRLEYEAVKTLWGEPNE